MDLLKYDNKITITFIDYKTDDMSEMVIENVSRYEIEDDVLLVMYKDGDTYKTQGFSVWDSFVYECGRDH